MARLVKMSANGPIILDFNGKKIEICGCGLTKNPDRLCDGSHNKTKDEKDGKTYIYDENFQKIEIEEIEDDSDEENHQCACGGNCGCH